MFLVQIDAIAKNSVGQGQGEEPRSRIKAQPLGDSQVLLSGCHEKVHIFPIKLCKTLHCCRTAVGCGVGLHHESPATYNHKV